MRSLVSSIRPGYRPVPSSRDLHRGPSDLQVWEGIDGVRIAQRCPGPSGRARPQTDVVSEGHGEPTPFPDPPTRISGPFRDRSKE